MARITQDTLIPLSILGAIVGLAFTFGIFYQNVQGAVLRIDELEAKQETYNNDLNSIRQSLARLEGAVGLKGAKRDK